MTPGQKLSKIMKEKGITQDQLSELFGNYKPTIHRILKDKQDFTFKILKVLPTKFKVDINHLLD
jgi:antitoxin component HigA of HigAB toxin-antitoxin module